MLQEEFLSQSSRSRSEVGDGLNENVVVRDIIDGPGSLASSTGGRNSGAASPGEYPAETSVDDAWLDRLVAIHKKQNALLELEVDKLRGDVDEKRSKTPNSGRSGRSGGRVRR